MRGDNESSGPPGDVAVTPFRCVQCGYVEFYFVSPDDTGL